MIGAKVPVPGGAVEELHELAVTDPAAVSETYAIHCESFDAAGQSDAFGRVIGIVVQPGVEFGHTDVIHFVPEKARALTSSLSTMPDLVFEAHSADCQHEDGLAALVE